LLLLVTLAWGWRGTRLAVAPPARLVRVEMELRSGGSIGSEVGTDVEISPDGALLAYVSLDGDAISHLFTLRLDQQQTTELDGTEGARAQFFSPDGRWIMFWAQGKVKKVPATGGPPITLCNASDMQGGSWGDDDMIVASLDATGKLWRFTSDDCNKPMPLGRSVPPVLGSWPQVLPGSTAVLFTANTDGANGANIDVLSLRDGTRKTLARGGIYGRYLANGYLTYLSNGRLFAVAFDKTRLETKGAPVAILDDVAYSPTFGYAQVAFSQDAKAVYRRSGSQFALEWVDRTGAVQPLLAKPARYIRPRFSPDGHRLAYSVSETSGLSSWIFDTDGNRTTRLDTQADRSYGAPVWTPDGRFVVLWGQSGMGWARADGTGRAEPLMHSQGFQSPWSFTRDGTRLAYFEFSPATGIDLWTVPIETSRDTLHAGTAEPFLKTPAMESYPAFSPDGRWLAYSSNESGSWEIYVRQFPVGSNKVQVSRGGGRVPFWSRNGTELFYATDRQRIMHASYNIRDGAFVPGTAEFWTERRLADTGVVAGLDLYRDGQRFAALFPSEPADQEQSANHVTLLLNFFDEVQRRVTAQH